FTAAEAAKDAPDPTEILALWPDGPPGGERVTAVETHEARPPPPGLRDRIVTHTRSPTMFVFRPERPNGAAIMICPGGGYIRVVRDKEGFEAARWLASRGYTCFVLTYRLPGDGWAAGANVPLQDAQRGLRLIRANAARYGVNPKRVGVQGFSAGGHVAAMLTTRFDDKVYEPVDAADVVSARPDFSCLMYPVIALSGPLAHPGSAKEMSVGPAVPVERRVTRNTPPVFMVHAKDDPAVPVGNATLMADALKAAGVPVELHLFETGNHGFGLRSIEGRPTAAWPGLFEAWLLRH
ncbi:MAG: alpha/beta hydrolase, partial [Caulobacter sp.]